jgi:ElaB/YqjD/DUF883 family membrane-anchored ribosome-binding protein
MTTTSKSLRTGADQSLANDAMRSGENVLDSTRQLAGQALDKAGEKMRDLRFGARDLASKSISTVGDTAAAAQQKLGRYADATGRYVSEQPVKSALIAAAVGAIVAGLIIAARRRNRSY